MTDLAAIGAAWEYWEGGDPEVLVRYIEEGGNLNELEIRLIILDYLRDKKQRRRQNWSRDRSIVRAIKLYRRGSLDGNKHSLEDTVGRLSEIKGWPGEERIYQIWKDRKK